VAREGVHLIQHLQSLFVPPVVLVLHVQRRSLCMPEPTLQCHQQGENPHQMW
jgi:hypothetical protein